MANTFLLHNRLGAGISIDTSRLEESALINKTRLEEVISQLKKMNLHLYSITDEEILEDEK